MRPEPTPAQLDAVYGELKRLARGYLSRERGGHTLQPTALVHEAFLRLTDQQVDWSNRAQVIGVGARQMRRILVDHARARNAAKRAAEIVSVDLRGLNESVLVHWVDLGTALDKLESIDAELVRVVELRFFGGLSIEETALTMSVSPATVKRLWGLARAWLYRELGN